MLLRFIPLSRWDQPAACGDLPTFAQVTSARAESQDPTSTGLPYRDRQSERRALSRSGLASGGNPSGLQPATATGRSVVAQAPAAPTGRAVLGEQTPQVGDYALGGLARQVAAKADERTAYLGGKQTAADSSPVNEVCRGGSEACNGPTAAGPQEEHYRRRKTWHRPSPT